MFKFIYNHLVGIGMFLALLIGPTALYALMVRSFEISWATQRIFLLSLLILVLLILVAGIIKKLKE
ncbi:MAG: hypothetical protein ACRCXQ_09525 [Vagococcus fluvialis]